jgi:hypothetical protein
MLFAEVVAFEAVILMAGYLPQPAAQVCELPPTQPADRIACVLILHCGVLDASKRKA